jgi:glyoxylase I family protein
MIAGIDHVHVVYTDLDQSIDFYTNKLGFEFLRRVEFGRAEARRQLAYVGLNGVLLELLPVNTPHEGLVPEGATRPFCLTVVDMEQTVEEMRARGIEVVAETRPGFSFHGKVASIRDPSGLVIELREWALPDGPAYPDWQPEREDVVRIG